jgi:transcription initiation factor TFIIIB Brf1 subunit/transcription initiation factor TFIIB
MQNQRFDSFDEELLEVFGDKYDSIKSKIDSKIDCDVLINEVCKHASLAEEAGITICKECGCEIEILDFQPEWRFYGASDSRSSKDPSRCHRSKEVTKGGIDKVFIDAKQMHLPLSIRKTTEHKYKEIVGDETVRGSGRRSIVAACLMYTYREEGDMRTSDEIRNIFDLTKQEMSTGLSRYHARYPADRVKIIKPLDLIRRIMYKTRVAMIHYKNICLIARCLENVDATLNRSSPQAVASAIVYLYLCLSPELRESIGFTKAQFANDVELSDITISKLVKKAASIIDTSIEV